MATGKESLSCVYDHYNIVVFSLHNNDCEICILDMAIAYFEF